MLVKSCYSCKNAAAAFIANWIYYDFGHSRFWNCTLTRTWTFKWTLYKGCHKAKVLFLQRYACFEICTHRNKGVASANCVLRLVRTLLSLHLVVLTWSSTFVLQDEKIQKGQIKRLEGAITEDLDHRHRYITFNIEWSGMLFSTYHWLPGCSLLHGTNLQRTIMTTEPPNQHYLNHHHCYHWDLRNVISSKCNYICVVFSNYNVYTFC